MPMLEINAARPSLTSRAGNVTEAERRFSVVEELEAVVTANLQRATRIRQSILQNVFTGELRFPDQSPTGETVTRVTSKEPQNLHKALL